MFGLSKKEQEEQKQYWGARIKKASATCTPADAERAVDIVNDIAALDLVFGRPAIVRILAHTIARIEELERRLDEISE